MHYATEMMFVVVFFPYAEYHILIILGRARLENTHTHDIIETLNDKIIR